MPSHPTDEFGYPLSPSHCPACADLSRRMANWYTAQVLSGNPDPDRFTYPLAEGIVDDWSKPNDAL